MSDKYIRYCCVYGCKNKAKKVSESGLSFFCLPKDNERREEWLRAIDREDLLHNVKFDKGRICYYVCSAHFDDSAIITSTAKRLTSDAMPTKFLPGKSQIEIHSDAGNLIITTNRASAQAPPKSSKKPPTRSSQKDNILESAYSHTAYQTETKTQKGFPNSVKTDPQIAESKIILDESLNKTQPVKVFPYDIKIEPQSPESNNIADESLTQPLKAFSYSIKIEPESPEPHIIEDESSNKTQPLEAFPCNIKIEPEAAEKVAKSRVSTSTQTDLRETSNKKTPTVTLLSDKTQRKRKLKKDIKIDNCKRTRLEQEYIKIQKELDAKNTPFLLDSEDEVTQRFMKLVEWQNKITNKFKGNLYDAEYKIFALNLHFASPHAYRFLQTVLKLPSKTTLHRLKLKIPPKLNDRVLNSLSLKIKSLPTNAKYCTICVDEMELKRNLYYDIKKDEVIGFHDINGSISPEIASNAYIIMLQGLYCNWKQPIAYALLGNTEHYAELDSWINEVILKLFGVGIELKAVVSDQGSNFDEYAKVIKKVTIDKPYFFIDEHKIFYICDVPHLLNDVRNYLLSNDFCFDKDYVSWNHIKTLFEHQQENNLRLTPKITDAHIEPNNSQRMKVKHAAQIFSNTVYAALETYIVFGKITEEARGTATFIKIMNDLFDVLNSSTIKSAKKHQSAFRMSAEQKSILHNAQHMFATIISRNSGTGKVNSDGIKTFYNFQITIQSVLQLFEDLKSEGFQYLFTRRLNHDSVKQFLGAIRQQGGSGSELTPIQFTRAFSKLFYVYMLKSDQINCEFDSYEILLKVDDIFNTEDLNPPDKCRPSLVALNGERDHCMDIPDENALTYVAGYLIYKCSKSHPDCKQMLETLDSSPKLDQAHFKAYNKNASFYGNLKMPSQEMNEYVRQLETAFTQNFQHYLHSNPGSEMFKLLQKIQLPPLPCECFPIDYFLKLFVRLRIYSTLKFNNRKFKLEYKSTKQLLNVKQL